MEKLKQKVASSSSRVIASLQQAANFPAQEANQQPADQARGLQEPAGQKKEEPQQQQEGDWLMADSATAHLTEQEREILRQVFRKEEQFKRDTIKQMAASRGLLPEGSPFSDVQPQQTEAGKQRTGKVLRSAGPGESSPHRATPMSSTPLSFGRVSRPGSSGTTDTPTVGGERARAGSLCSSGASSMAAQQASCSNETSGSSPASCRLGQCRICRKFISATESCHLCSNCNQFICEDCASYSATDQHWMCSSCRRRIAKPAIPADTMKELGLNQNSTAVRRMTLRLNQNELKKALAKGSSSSSSSSNSSSGCSSMCNAMQLRQMRAKQNPTEERQPPPNDDSNNPSQPAHLQAQKTLSQPMSSNLAERAAPGPAISLTSARAAAQQSAPPTGPPAKQQAIRGQGRPAQVGRRVSVADGQPVSGRRSSRVVAAGAPERLQRKQSTAFFTAQDSLKFGPRQHQLQQRFLQEAAWLQQQNRQHPASQLQRPHTLVTASSDISIGDGGSQQDMAGSRRASIFQSHQLIPIPPDQIHLRRLSDQSNLVRRSSIIANAEAEGVVQIVRNRSYSNIDAAPYGSYFYQLPFMQLENQNPANEDFCYDDDYHNQYQSQYQPSETLGRRASRQDSAQLFAGQQVAGGHMQQQLSSIITPYNQKSQRQSTGEHQSQLLHSDSSSDIDEDPHGVELEAGMPGDYFAPHAFHQQVGSIMPSIPSVSVSEFNSSQQRLHLQQQQQQQQQMQFEHISPMQINVAIEQAIQQQTNNEMRLAPYFGQVRRGSSGRVLPKIPGEQSRSLLDLPLNGGGPGRQGAELGQSNDQFAGQSRLDLPNSGAVRRASAPEGQNIKIVVDDMDGRGGMMMHGAQPPAGTLVYGKQGELYERLVLYRDDSLDPNTNMARGFGLQVIGGKIQHEQAQSEKQLQAVVTWVLPGGPADKVGLKCGDKIIEWDGKCLVNMTYEQVADVIESSANIAELLVRPAHKLDLQTGGSHYVRSQRRLSQQTERDLRRTSLVPSEGGQILTTQNRSGTGRRLPQIPTNTRGSLAEPVMGVKHASTSQLASNGHQSDFVSPKHLGASVQQDQQSRSANELYQTNFNQNPPIEAHRRPSQGHLMALDVSRTVPMNGASSAMALNHYGPTGAHNTRLSTPDEICGLIGLQVNVDERNCQLEISILSAINIDRNPNRDHYVRVKILPECNRFKACTTQPSSDMSWKETFIFQNFPTDQIQRMALEIGIWVYDEAPRLSTQIAQPICEALIPIQSARERNTDFWPLRPPPTSPQARRKSLNDLIGVHPKPPAADQSQQLSAGYQTTSVKTQRWSPSASRQQSLSGLPPQQQQQQLRPIEAYDGLMLPTGGNFQAQAPIQFVRERSSSNRNLPDTNKLRAQPRRASDEVAGCSTSGRLSARVSPAASRRSISVMNVGDGTSSFQRPSSRLGSQSNILKIKRDSQGNLSGQQFASGGSKYGSPTRASGAQSAPRTVSNKAPTPPSSARDAPQSQTVVTASGRRSSVVGVQSMVGYRSQKNSQSDATDQESPLNSATSFAFQKRANQSGSTTPKEQAGQQRRHRGSVVGIVSTSENQSGRSSQSNSRPRSRRGSGEQTPQLQRKGSFAMLTLRRIKRTMSLTKQGDEQADVNQDSRRESSSSAGSASEPGLDMGVGRRIIYNTDYVGKLRLSFILTKGQLEIEVISAQDLKYDREAALGVYVKLFLKGKSKGNKKKTRVVQALEPVVFKQLIKYDGSLVDNKSLEVSVWQKQGGLRGKTPIGFTEIRLSELDLAQLQTSWYNLHPMDIFCSSSIED